MDAKNNYDSTALILAASRNHYDVVRYLLENGADANAKDTDDKTALMVAKEEGHKECVQLLQKAGAEE